MRRNFAEEAQQKALETRAAQVYEAMYEARSLGSVGAYFREVKEALSAAIQLARPLGRAAAACSERLEHSRAVYDAQMALEGAQGLKSISLIWRCREVLVDGYLEGAQ